VNDISTQAVGGAASAVAPLKPDLCVIGAGSGGLSVAAAAAMMGVQVVLIERDRMGGDCLNVGCVPSKALIAAAAEAVGHAGGRILPGRTVPPADFAAAMAHVRRVIAAIAPNDSEARFRALGVTVLKAEARFVDGRTVEAGGQSIRARRFIIATGSRPKLPPIPGLAEAEPLTNESIFSLTERPELLIVIGAGPIGLELGQTFRRLGAAVTVLEAGRPLAKDDPEAAAVVLRALEHEGVVLRSGVRIAAVSREGDGAVSVALEGGETVTGSHLLVAAGRAPTITGLELEKADVATSASGIVVDAGLRTSNRRIYAIGDVAGGLQFTHAANQHAGLVVRSALFRMPVRFEPSLIPRVTYTAPELAAVGLSEEEAIARHGKDIRILRWPFAENDRAQATAETEGHIKVLTRANGRILGCTIVGAHAGELITPWTLAIGQKLGISAMAGLVVPYPTLSEVSKRVATSFYLKNLRHPLLRRLLAVLRSLG
jgi:pyruvate/2-oxoglutarate dehydrogenase complex dihydrolipoamide dehydrogenase (E3) component